jgi:chorismate mutase
MIRFLLVVVMLISCTDIYKKVNGDEYTLESVRASLIRQEDTIVFNVIERARFPLNSPTYDQHYASIPNFSGSLFDFILNKTEDIQAKVCCCSLPCLITFDLSMANR